ncbi:MAG: hypothetical protein IPG50_21710 [Myxococcales bacterium]|nr:hypothetical protein [Myxococcales bacterium]
MPPPPESGVERKLEPPPLPVVARPKPTGPRTARRQPWLDEARETLKRLEVVTRLPGWDDEGAEAFPASRWESARSFVAMVVLFDVPRPMISPCGDGYIHFEWRDGERTVLAELGDAKHVVSASSPSERTEETFSSLGDLLLRTTRLLDQRRGK